MIDQLALPGPAPVQWLRAKVARVFPDPRVPVILLLFGYLVLGFTVLGFNRSPQQALLTSVSACALELFLSRVFKHKFEFPFSALITSLGLSLLLNYSHGYFVLLVPVYFAIGSKYLLTFKGRHFFNPAMLGVALSLLFSSEFITSAPAYQWNGIGSMVYFISFPALMFLMPMIDRTPLVSAFLVTFSAQVALRALIMRHHLPFETLFWGTLSSPSFLLFTFFMITDPKTSPSNPKLQVKVGIAIALVDLLFHIFRSYYTFFYAAFTVASFRFLQSHWKESRGDRAGYVRRNFFESGYYQRPLVLGVIAVAGLGSYRTLINPLDRLGELDWHFEKVSVSRTGVDARFSDVFAHIDPRVQHVAKWILSVGDSVATADVDGDGLPDLFLTNGLKRPEDRLSLYRNLGGFRFEKVAIPALEDRKANVVKYGLPTNAMFIDYNNDGLPDLFITYAFGSPVLLKNVSKAHHIEFVDVTHEVGLDHFTNSVAATWLDVNRDGRLDLIITNVLPVELPGYSHPQPLNLFHLPEPEYEGDRRMFRFMHESWNHATNGGLNELYLQNADGKFVKQDAAAWGMPETGWSLAVATADFNGDGWPDFYVANDFGEDDLYLNENGTHFRNIKGRTFGSIGKDTYKGMNVSIGDLRHTGTQDIYVSNVHHALQAEGSLLWTLTPDPKNAFLPEIEDHATQMGILNEQRFGWGAALADFNNDGWIDIVQANGMVDDSIDHLYESCPDYWYVNEKIARSGPEIHSYADRWGDIRGRCLYGTEQNRVYLNRGTRARPQFADVADQVGLTELGNSRGMAAVDLNNDGRLDLVTTHMFKAADIYQNVLKAPSTDAHFIGFALKGDGKFCNRDGIGSTLRLLNSPDGAKLVKEMRAVNGLNAQDDRRVHFGLGKNVASVTVEVNWCGIRKEVYPDLEADRYHDLQMIRKN